MGKKVVILLMIILLLLLSFGIILGVLFVLKYFEEAKKTELIPEEEAQHGKCETVIDKKQFKNQCPTPKFYGQYSSDIPIETENKIAKKGRMSGWKPYHYEMHLKFMDKRNFSGNVSITMKLMEPTKSIILNLDSTAVSVRWNQLRFREHCSTELICPTVIQMPALKLQNTSTSMTAYMKQYVEIIFAENLQPGSIYQIDFPNFNGRAYDYNEKTGSMGIYQANRMGASWALGTIFQMRGARTVFPSFDHPSLKAKFALCIEHRKGVEAASNTPVAEIHRYPNGEQATCFQTTPKISTYIFTFSVFSKMRTHSRNVTLFDNSTRSIGAIVQDSVPRARTEWMLEEAEKITQFLSQMTQIPYVLPKLNFINVIPAPFWGIENFGLVTLDYSWMRTPDYDNVHTILVHEIVHQWLGNLVTIKRWDEICLQEGLTAYVTAYIANKLKLISGRIDIKMEELRNNAMNGDRGRNSILNSFHMTQQIADRCFQKPPVIFKMIHDTNESGNFTRDFLRKLLKDYLYENAGIDEWAETMNAVSEKPQTGQMLKSWFSTPGYPVMTLALDRNTNEATVTQKRFRNQTIVPSRGEIFVTSVTSFDSKNSSYSILMDNETISIPVRAQAKWVVLNREGHDYYTTLYDAQNYRNILDCFKQDASNSLRPDNSGCLLSPREVNVVFQDFCTGLIADQFPVETPTDSNSESGSNRDLNLWRDIFADLRNMTDLSIQGQRRLQLNRQCICCFKLRQDLDDLSEWFCQTSWNRYCSNLGILKSLGRNWSIDVN